MGAKEALTRDRLCERKRVRDRLHGSPQKESTRRRPPKKGGSSGNYRRVKREGGGRLRKGKKRLHRPRGSGQLGGETIHNLQGGRRSSQKQYVPSRDHLAKEEKGGERDKKKSYVKCEREEGITRGKNSFAQSDDSEGRLPR